MLATKEEIDDHMRIWYIGSLRKVLKIMLRHNPHLRREVDGKITGINEMRKLDLVQLYLELRQKYA